MFINEAAKSLSGSLSLKMRMKISAAKSQNADFIDFSIGEPSDCPPKYLADACVKAIRDNDKFGYTPISGVLELRKEIAAMYNKHYDLSYNENNVMIGVGVKQAIYNAFVATLSSGDKVIIPTPCWPTYEQIVTFVGGEVVKLPCSIENGFAIDFAKLSSLIDEKTKWIVINSPSNPTGSMLSVADLNSLAELMDKHQHLHLLSDDIYSAVVYKGKFTNILSVRPDLYKRCLIVDGFSKCFRIPGWRFGFGIGDTDLIKAMSGISMLSTMCPTSIVQYAALEVFKNFDKKEMDKFVEELREKRDFACEELAKIDGLPIFMPNGALYVVCDISRFLGMSTASGRIITDSVVLTEYLIDEAKVAVLPGEMICDPRYIRICFASSMDSLKEGLARMSIALRFLK